MRITKPDNIISLILFVAVIALPAYFSMESWMVFAMYSVAAITVVSCWRLSYLRRNQNEKETI